MVTSISHKKFSVQYVPSVPIRITVKISACILNKLREWGFDLTRLRGQGYGECSTMSGEVSGVKCGVFPTLPVALPKSYRCQQLSVSRSC
jgi:hypothetical protein